MKLKLKTIFSFLLSVLFSITCLQATMQIFVSISDKKVTLNVDANDTIENIKEKIKHKKNIPSKEQKIIFAGEELEEGKTLSDYNIEEESVIYLKNRLKGPSIQAANFKYKKKSYVMLARGKDLKDGKDIIPGMDVQGTCRNKSCKLKNRKVWCSFNFSSIRNDDDELIVEKHGIKWFDFGLFDGEVKCIQCGESLENAETIRFTSCYYKIKGKVKKCKRSKEKNQKKDLMIPEPNAKDLLKNSKTWYNRFEKVGKNKQVTFQGGDTKSYTYSSLWIAVYPPYQILK